jgi:hypothetical protein
MRFEPGIFARSPDGEFTVGWGGFASSETAIRAWIHDSVPGIPAELALCVDVAAFVERC